MLKRVVLGLLLSAVVVSLFLFARAQRARRADAMLAPHTGEASTVAEDLQLLRQEVNQLKNNPHIQPVYVAAPPAQTASATTEVPADPKAARELERRKLAETAATLDKRFNDETVDPGWAQRTAGKIRSDIAAAAIATRVLSSACSSSLCRVVLEHDDESSQMGIAQLVRDLPDLSWGVFYAYDESARPPRTTLYVLREGKSIGDLTSL